jgi:hypothetical protein
VFVVFVLVVGLGLSVLSASAWYGYVSSLRRQAVASSLGNVKSILGASLQRDNELLASVNAAVATHPQITNAALTAYLSKLDLSQNYPGTIAFTYVESVNKAGLAAFEAVTRRDPPLGVPAPNSGPVARSLDGQSTYCLTRLAAVELPSDQGALGDLLLNWVGPYLSAHFNFCHSSFQQLLDGSARTGKASVTSVVSLVYEAPPGMPAVPLPLMSFVSRLPIFVQVSPVYSGPGAPSSTGARARALVGWTLGIFDANEILSPAMANERGISLVLTYRGPGARPAVLARAGRAEGGAVTQRVGFPADPGWTAEVTVGPQSSGPPPALQGGAVLFGSLSLTVLLVILLNQLITSRRSALELVDERTSELRHLALHDALTGLPNRSLVDERARSLLSRGRDEGLPIAVFFIDLDDLGSDQDRYEM